MIKLTILSALLISGTASASYFQENCSNGSRTVEIRRGHTQSYVAFTERTSAESTSNYSDQMIKVPLQHVVINYAYICNAETPKKSKCVKEWEDGLKLGSYTNLVKVSVTKADGSKFSEKTLNVSEDGKSVDAILVCDGVLF